MTDHEKRIREALEAGPTEGPWVADHANPNLVAGDSDPYEYICQVAPAEFSESNHSYEQECINAAYIASCNPAAIRALLADLDAVRGRWRRSQRLTTANRGATTPTGQTSTLPAPPSKEPHMTDLVAQLVGALERLLPIACDSTTHPELSIEILDARAALSAAKDGGWLPIETAPVGREMFVVIGVTSGNGFTGGRPYTSDPYCVWQPEKGEFSRWPHNWPPTHWQPLSNPPKGEV